MLTFPLGPTRHYVFFRLGKYNFNITKRDETENNEIKWIFSNCNSYSDLLCKT